MTPLLGFLFHAAFWGTFSQSRTPQGVNSYVKEEPDSLINHADFNSSYKDVEHLSVYEICSPHTFHVEDNKLYVLASSSEDTPYTCQQRFEAKNISSSVNLNCIKMYFGAHCQYEAMTISVDDQDTKLCKGKLSPTEWEGKTITMHYFRTLHGIYGGYVCSLTAVPSMENRNSSKRVLNETVEYSSNEPPLNLIGSFAESAFFSSASFRGARPPRKTKSLKEPIVIKSTSLSQQCTKCGLTSSDHKQPRTNREKNEKDVHPWFAVLIVEHSMNKSSLCSATLISTNHLLTTAQCLNKDVIEIQVGLGKYNLSDENEKGSMWVKTRNFSFHVDFDPLDSIEGGLFHVAVVTLPSPVAFTDFIRPICLPSPDFGNMAGGDAKGVGWGLTAFDKTPGFILMEINLKIENNEKCLTGLPIENFQICAKPFQQGNGYHDVPGEPLMVQRSGQWILVGLYAHGFTLPFNQVSDLYIRLTSIKPWLDTLDLDGICN